MKTTHVSVRLSCDAWARYSAQAQAEGEALGTYLRRRLEEQDRLMEGELAALRYTIEHAAAAPVTGRNAELPQGALIEALLLLRSMAGPQKATVAQKEVERRGLEAWR